MEHTSSPHISARLTVKARTYYSLQHIQSAALFTRQCFQIEKNYDGTFSDDLLAAHRAYVTGAIFASVSFLEASINELFADTADNPYSEPLTHLDTSTKLLMADMWKRGIPRTSNYQIVEKFQIALTLARKPSLDLGHPPFQDAQTLIIIRNALIHYEPVWTSGEEEQADKRILSLRQEKKFSLNPLIPGKSNPFFPDKCLSYGCARWAVNTSIQFVEEFSSKMGIPILFDHVRTRLNTEP